MSEAPPRGWVTVPLRSVGRWAGGGTPSKAEPRYWTNGTIPWVSPKDMKVATLHDAEDHITEDAVQESATRVIEAGSVLIVTRSGILQRILPVAVNAVPVSLNQDMKAITPHDGVDERYLYWMLVWLGDEILRRCTKSGTTVASVEITRLYELPVPLAPLPEQRRIVAAIEEHLSALDAAMAGLVRARANITRCKQAVIDAATSHAETVPLGSVLREPLRNGRSAPKSFDGRGVRVFSISAVTQGDFSERNTKIAKLDAADVESIWAQSGDIFIQRSNTPELVGTARMFRGPERFAVFPDLLIRVRTCEDVMPEFVELALQSTRVRHYFRSVAQGIAGSMPKIDQTAVERTLIPLVPLEAQRQIVDSAKNRLDVIERTSTELEIQLARAARLRQAILQRAFSGGLVPQDPADAAASIAPERDRTERTSAPGSSRPARGRGRTARTGNRRG